MTELRTQPNDQQAEQIVLGSMMISASATDVALGMLVGSDFYVPNHGTIFETIASLREAREPVEVEAVHARLLNNGTLQRIGGAAYLAELIHYGRGVQVGYYAAQVAEYAHRRALITAGTQIVQRAFEQRGESASEITTWAAERLRAVEMGTGAAVEAEPLTADDLLAEPPGYTWAIPGLLEQGDRLMLTGAEGSGKSTLCRQIAVTAAAGIHPFTGRPFTPQRVMVVDCENGPRLSMRRYNPLVSAAMRQGHPIGANLRVFLEPQGIDLAQRTGTNRLLALVEKVRPDVLVIGPLYRLHMTDPSDEIAARRVAATLDRAREIHGAAVVVESHSPHQGMNGKRPLRPIGSSLWLRWPEFGFGLQRRTDDASRSALVSDFRPWRGPRDERSWPKTLRSGGRTSPWPWVEDGAEDAEDGWGR